MRPLRPLLSIRPLASVGIALVALASPALARAQTPPPGQLEPLPAGQPAPAPGQPTPPATDPLNEPPSTSPANPPSSPPYEPPPRSAPTPPVAVEEPEEGPQPMSEGRAIVSAWNTGFQWGLAPGVIFQNGKTGFFLGVRLGYGFDTGSVILVPGVRLAAYFTDPNVYLGMPVMKVVIPIDRFAPFLEAGAGAGHVAGGTGFESQTGAALLGGGGFMIHFTPRFALGAEANYTAITGTGFRGFGVGPIIALAF